MKSLSNLKPANYVRAMATASSLAITAVFAGSAVHAADTYRFAIDAQPLPDAILQFSELTKVVVTVPTDLITGKTSPTVQGEMSAKDALIELLTGMPLEVMERTDGSLMVVRTSMANMDGASGADSAGDEEASFVLEEIIVTAEKRAESLQDIPIAISAFSGEVMERSGVTGISDLKQLASSLQFGESSSNTFVSIRGVGTEIVNLGAETGVTISQDGIPFTTQYMLDADFLDVERVEVLRGPQGTISGRNATGGAINIHSKRPTEEFEGSLKMTIGNYERLDVEGMVSGPVFGSKLLGRFVVRSERADGWLKNTFRDELENGTDKIQARASFLASLTEDVEAYLVLEGTIDRDTGVSALSLGRARPDKPGSEGVFEVSGFHSDTLEYQADSPNTGRKENYKAILKLVWDLGSSASITSTTGYISHTFRRKDDFDGLAVSISAFDAVDMDYWQATQEITLTADLTDRLDLILGGLYIKADGEQFIDLGLPQIGLPLGSLVFFPDQGLDSYAAYTQLRYRLTENVRLSAGIRYTRDEKSVADMPSFSGAPGVPFELKGAWNAITPRFAIDYAASDDLMIYASVSRGFKSGGFNTFGYTEFNPEFLWNYEAGLKAFWLDQRLRTGLSVFSMDYTDMQQNKWIVSATTGVASVIENAGKSTIKGIEAEIEAQLTDRLTILGAATWMDPAYDELVSVDNIYPELGVLDLSGNQLVRAPKWQLNLSGQYETPITDDMNAVLRVDYQWQDRIYFSFFNHDLNSQDSYGLLNLSAGIETDDGVWALTAFAHNVFDEKYIVDSGSLPAETPGSEPTRRGNVGAPRMYGISLAYKF